MPRDDDAMPPASAATSSASRARLGQLYREHADFVWRVLLRFGIPESQAEDVAHEVFLVVRRRLPDYDAASPFRAWLYGIARGVAANVRRSHQRSEQRLRVVQAPPEPPTPEDHVQRSQAALLVERFVETLSPPQREVFVLIDIEGMKGPEAARALRTKVNVVYSRLRLARGHFKQFVATAAAEARGREETA